MESLTGNIEIHDGRADVAPAQTISVSRPAGRRPRNEPRNVLPSTLPPRGLNRVQAAAYVGVSATTFDRMILDKLMPRPTRIYGRTVWDIRKLDAAFTALDTDAAEDDPCSRLAL